MGDADGGMGDDVGGDFPRMRKFSSYSTVSATVDAGKSVDVSKKKPRPGRSTRREKRLVIALILLAAITFILIILIAVYVVKYNNIKHKPKVCFSEECVIAGATLQATLDLRVDPCVDFYKFACGSWYKAHPTPAFSTNHDWTAIQTMSKLRAVRGNLEAKSTDNDPDVLHQMRLLYATCVDQTKADSQSIKPLWRVLEKQGVTAPLPTPANESFPTVTPPSADATPFRLQKALIAAHSLGIHLLVKIGAEPLPENVTDVRMTIHSPPGDNILPGYPHYEERVGRRLTAKRRKQVPETGEEDETEDTTEDGLEDDGEDMGKDEDRVEAKWAARCMTFVYGLEEVKRTGDIKKLMAYKTEDFMSAARRVLRFEKKLKRVIQSAKNTTDWELIDLKAIQANWDNNTEEAEEWLEVSWHEVLKATQKALQVPDALQVQNNTEIVIGGKGYLPKLAALLANSGPEIVNDYIWWTMVKSLGFYTSETLRGYKDKYMAEEYEEYSPPARSLFCTSTLHKLLPDIATYSLYTVEEVENATRKVTEMMDNVMWSFAHSVRHSRWLDRETKQNALKKLKHVRVVIGAPNHTYDWYTMDKYHSGLKFKRENFLDDMLAIRTYRQYRIMQRFVKPNVSTGWDGNTGPLDSDAFYTEDFNTILITLGMLKFPFSGNGLDALDYGALGSVLGHELSHAFDDTGRSYDYVGNFKSWWTNSSAKKYENRSSCFVQQYDRIRVPDTGGLKVDGKLTLNENIADNGGLKHAHNAFKKARSRRSRGEPSHALPGFERFNEEQLFFLSYANSWCETWTSESQLAAMSDTHAPTYARVIVPLQNSRAFSHAFKCTNRAPMRLRDEDTCELW